MIEFLKTAVLLIFMTVFFTSCTTTRVISNSGTPDVEIESSGIIWVGDRQVQPGRIGKALRSAGYSKSGEIKVLIADKRDRGLMRAVTSDLVMSGYKRPLFITEKITRSTTGKK
ncbi:MAG: hypothetical protein R6V06_03820 [Kiritimatiellia bacterium]